MILHATWIYRQNSTIWSKSYRQGVPKGCWSTALLTNRPNPPSSQFTFLPYNQLHTELGLPPCRTLFQLTDNLKNIKTKQTQLQELSEKMKDPQRKKSQRIWSLMWSTKSFRRHNKMADKNCMMGVRALDSKLKIEITHKWSGCPSKT